MTIIHAHFDGKVFVPKSPVTIPADTDVTLLLGSEDHRPLRPPADPKRPLADLLERIGGPVQDPDLPKDLSKRHDFYRYGIPDEQNGDAR